jgi:hypothetical protein
MHGPTSKFIRKSFFLQHFDLTGRLLHMEEMSAKPCKRAITLLAAA